MSVPNEGQQGSSPHHSRQEVAAVPDEGDKNRFLELAKLYEGSWNGLRDFEWKMAFALWTSTLAAIVLAATKPESILGINIKTEQFFRLFNWVVLLVLVVALILLWVGYVLAQFSVQSAYAYFGSNRDYYIRRVAGIPLRPNEPSEPPVFGGSGSGPPAVWHWVLPLDRNPEAAAWRRANNWDLLPTGWLSVIMHAFITGALFLFAFLLIWNATYPESAEKSKEAHLEMKLNGFQPVKIDVKSEAQISPEPANEKK